ncbi:hypothetical protein [Pseudomonas sp. GZD-222]|uniref:hypothetical protein n=1 Tax=Pseudomonas sp. GZD-222 TaxID=3404805 RepID=UPI003BB72805
MRAHLFTLRLLQSLGLVLIAYLFVCLMTAEITQSSFSLKLPSLIDPGSDSTIELLLFTVPGQLLFLLLGCFIHRRRLLGSAFVLLATMPALLQCLLFAETFGNTWSSTEILGLLGFNLPWLLLALVPGLALLMALEYWPGSRQAA